MQIAEIDGRLGRVLRIKAIEETDATAVGESGEASTWKLWGGQVRAPPSLSTSLSLVSGISSVTHNQIQ